MFVVRLTISFVSQAKTNLFTKKSVNFPALHLRTKNKIFSVRVADGRLIVL